MRDYCIVAVYFFRILNPFDLKGHLQSCGSLNSYQARRSLSIKGLSYFFYLDDKPKKIILHWFHFDLFNNKASSQLPLQKKITLLSCTAIID